ncbi:MAG: hypothetical protein E4H18_01620 [Hyphomicrobiales bacterium]|nr:MAG: hypothetical protein E4H18_01620 [Hyphomicrobiales bacterium]
MDIGKTLRVTSRGEWRDWLERHHAIEREIWLVNPNKKAVGEGRLPYNDAVEEALCFGWIDSIVKSLDEAHAVQRYTPRRPGSPLSEMNKERIRRLEAMGRMTPAGHAVIGNVLSERFEVPADILAALQVDEETWRNFQAFPESYQRIRVGWIDASRNRPDFFETRLRYFLRLTKQNKRYGMVQ